MNEQNVAILGTYEGECADATITNLNGLDITREVWETVFASEEYKNGLEKGYYIGFLGHPEDPGCQDYKDACIVMREGHIEDSGKVKGRFDLVDTPVGRIVKTFQDAGVTFGISVRGAGDIYNNSVDPDTFVFRGFDLVTFPAYPNAIPQFVAASEDPAKRKQYERICASVTNELPAIESPEALGLIKTYFAPQSDVYHAIEDRTEELIGETSDTSEVCEECEDTSIEEEKLDAMTNLYLEKAKQVEDLQKDVDRLNKYIATQEVVFSRKLDTMRRITSSQTDMLDSMFVASQKKVEAGKASLAAANKEVTKLHRQIEAATRISDRDHQTIADLQNKLNSTQENLNRINLKYKQDIRASEQSTKDKDAVIASTEAKLAETVEQVKDLRTSASNRDEKLRRQQQWITSAKKLIADYQDAYANLYANAIGGRIDGISVTESTSVSELQSMIAGSTSMYSYDNEEADASDIFIDTADECDLVTL